MYWWNYEHLVVIFYRTAEPTAKKIHECCECGAKIFPGNKYQYYVGKWNDQGEGDWFSKGKTCLNCVEDWKNILRLFEASGNYKDAGLVHGLLKEAIQDAFNYGVIEKEHPLVQKWIFSDDIQTEKFFVDPKLQPPLFNLDEVTA